MDAATGVKTASEIAQSQYVFGILFIILFAAILWGGKILLTNLLKKVEQMHVQHTERLTLIMDDSKAESKEREIKLIDHSNSLVVQLQSQTSSLEEINRTQVSMQMTQEKMQENLSKIEQRIDQIENQN